MYDLLKGLTIVEGATFIAGPTCALHMAQMGATVIRFDQIGGGPDSKRWPVDDAGHSLYWEGINKGKKSIGIDLSRPAGRELAQRLATSGDGLFVTNFPVAGFLAYERLAALRPDLICLRIMGWADGTPAVDYTINASLGVPWITGQPDDPRPVNHVLPAWDLMAGAYAAFTLICAERDRSHSGQGREIRLALSDLAAATMGTIGSVAETLQRGDRARAGNDLYGAFGRDFPTADGQRLMLVAITPRQWTGLVTSLGIGDAVGSLESRLGVSFTRDEGLRFTHSAELVPLVAAEIVRRPAAELAAVFEANGVCWSHYRTLSEAMVDEPRFFTDNPIFSDVQHPSGTYPTAGAAARIPGLERQPAASSPRFGEHTDEVLTTLLGLDSTEIASLHDAGIVG